MTEIPTITLTFGDAGENHAGMEMLGSLGEPGTGFSVDELRKIEKSCQESGIKAEFHDFSLSNVPEASDAGVLIIRKYVDLEMSQCLFKELVSLNWDTKYWDRRRAKVLNKHARANLVIVDGLSQQPDYENAKGTIIDGLTLPLFRAWKKTMVEGINLMSATEKANNLVGEGNLYRDVTKCGIGYHGDTERRKVIALRLGQMMPMCWQWFHRSKPVGEGFGFQLETGDLYIMSERAVGNNWRYSSQYTLRHAAGADKYISLARYQKK